MADLTEADMDILVAEDGVTPLIDDLPDEPPDETVVILMPMGCM